MNPADLSGISHMPIASQGDSIRDIIREVVAEVAPDELPIVDGLAMIDHAHAVRQMRKRPRKQEHLGFGLGEVAVLVTPILWLALNEAAKQIVGDTVKMTGNRLKAATIRIFGKAAGPATLPAMNEKQREALRQEVITSALEKGLPRERAYELADALISRIATGRAGEPPSIESAQ